MADTPGPSHVRHGALHGAACPPRDCLGYGRFVFVLLRAFVASDFHRIACLDTRPLRAGGHGERRDRTNKVSCWSGPRGFKYLLKSVFTPPKHVENWVSRSLLRPMTSRDRLKVFVPCNKNGETRAQSRTTALKISHFPSHPIRPFTHSFHCPALDVRIQQLREENGANAHRLAKDAATDHATFLDEVANWQPPLGPPLGDKNKNKKPRNIRKVKGGKIDVRATEEPPLGPPLGDAPGDAPSGVRRARGGRGEAGGIGEKAQQLAPKPWYVGARLGEASKPGPPKATGKRNARAFEAPCPAPKVTRKRGGRTVNLNNTQESDPTGLFEGAGWSGDAFRPEDVNELTAKGLLRLCCLNIDGGARGTEFTHLLRAMQSLGMGAWCMQETGVVAAKIKDLKVQARTESCGSLASEWQVDVTPAVSKGNAGSWGTAQAMSAHYTRFAGSQVEDKRKLGRYGGRVFQPRKGGPGILIMNVYHTVQGRAAWKVQQEYIKAQAWDGDPPDDPSQLLRWDIRPALEAAKAQGLHILLCGDFNEHWSCGAGAPADALDVEHWPRADLEAAGTGAPSPLAGGRLDHATWWGSMLEDLELVDVHATVHGTDGALRTRRPKGALRGRHHETRLDYFVADRALVLEGHVTAVGVLESQVSLNESDHKLLAIELRMGSILGLKEGDAEPWERPALIKLAAGDKRMVEAYEAACGGMEEWVAAAREEYGCMYAERENGYVDDHAFREFGARIESELSAKLVAAVSQLKVNSPSFKANFKDGWSPQMVRCRKIAEVCAELRAAKGGALAKADHRRKLLRLTGVKGTDVPSAWGGGDDGTWDDRLKATEQVARRSLHGRARAKERMRMAYLVRRAEYRRRNGQIGKFVRAITGDKKGGGPMVSFKGSNLQERRGG